MPATQKVRSIDNREVQTSLQALASPVVHPRGAVIFEQGELPAGVFVVRKGAVRLTIKSGTAEILMRIAHEGAVLGLPATLSGKPYSLTARAVHACELDFVERKDVVDLVRRDPAIGMQILQMLSDEVRNARVAMASSR